MDSRALRNQGHHAGGLLILKSHEICARLVPGSAGQSTAVMVNAQADAQGNCEEWI